MIIVGTQDFVLVECPQSCPHVADAIFFVTINIQQLNTNELVLKIFIEMEGPSTVFYSVMYVCFAVLLLCRAVSPVDCH